MMFVVSSIQEEYCGEIVVRELAGNCRAVTINKTHINVPINLQNVLYFHLAVDGPNDHAPEYQIVFQFQRFNKTWEYFKAADRDRDYEKLLSLNSIGVMCKLEDIE